MRRILVGLAFFSTVVGLSFPASAEEAPLYRDFTVSLGLVSNASMTVVSGFNFTSQLSPAFVNTLGFEMGNRTLPGLLATPLTSSSDAHEMRFRAAITTNSWGYIGAGATYTKISAVTTSAIAATDTGSVEAIAGLRIPVLGGTIGAEHRLGLSGLSTTSLFAGFKL